MMGHRQVEQAALFYEFSLERHVPADHLLRSIDRFVELGELRRELSPFYSAIGRPSVDPELMIRMLIVGYCCGIRSERRLCEEVHRNLASRWLCASGSMAMCPTIRPSRRTGMAASIQSRARWTNVFFWLSFVASSAHLRQSSAHSRYCVGVVMAASPVAFKAGAQAALSH